MSALSGPASFVRLQDVLTARSQDGFAAAPMTFEAFEVEIGHAVRSLEHELKAADLARSDVDAEAVLVEGKECRKCLENQPKTYLSSSGPVTVARTLYRPADGGKCICRLGAACRDHCGVIHTHAGAAGVFHDGAHDLRRDERAVHRARHLGAIE